MEFNKRLHGKSHIYINFYVSFNINKTSAAIRHVHWALNTLKCVWPLRGANSYLQIPELASRSYFEGGEKKKRKEGRGRKGRKGTEENTSSK